MLGFADAPLTSVRVLDVGGPRSGGVGRILADLGADVLVVEPPGDNPARHTAPRVAGSSVAFAMTNANKRGTVLDPAQPGDRATFIELAETADIVVDSGIPGAAAAFGVPSTELAERFDHLVVLSVTDFGTTGPRAGWRATDQTLCALSTALSRSGPTAGRPVLPPAGLASATVAVQAAWAALAAYYHRLRGGRGDYLDFSRLDGVLLALDPPFGSQGQATAGAKRADELWRGRPRNQHIYPIFGCRDGFVRLCLLSARQWRGMRAWLGEPEQFADPKFETVAARYAASRELNAVIADMFARQSMDELVSEGQTRGVPVAPVLSPDEALQSDHFRAVGALTHAELGPGATVTVPAGPLVIDGTRAGYRRPSPRPDSGSPRWAQRPAAGSRPDDDVARPFDGVRIIDLGVIVAGGELGRLFADLGAEVIKVESAAYPDGLRQAPPDQPMSRSWALTHRNESSLGLDLRHPAGAEVFARLVAGADAVFANFKPGTLAALGFPPERLHELNPGLVITESSAFGADGPWSARMGYGPLVRAATGVTRLWTDRQAGTDFYDATTVFPDHVSARVAAIGALATMIRRMNTGTGAHVQVSQAEVAMGQLAVTYATQSARAAGLPVDDGTELHAVCRCAGDDEWCVVSVCSGQDRQRLAAVLGVAELPREHSDFLAVMEEWTSSRDKTAITETMQAAGIAAAPMQRAIDVLTDPQVTFRGLYTELTHPLFAEPMPAETNPAPYQHIPLPESRPAPGPGEQTREICHKILGMDAAEIDRLLEHGALFSTTEDSGNGAR